MKKVRFDLSSNKTKIISNRYDPYSELENSIIENINDILEIDSNSDDEYECNEILDKFERTSYETNSIENLNNTYENFSDTDSSDEEYESNEIVENFEGTIYDTKLEETKNRLVEYNILVDIKLDKYFLIMNDKKYNFNILEELYEFESNFYKYLDDKNIYKKKNKKNKKKYNESLEIFLNKYEIFREELENILKFNIQENSTKKIISEEYHLMNEMIKKNKEYIIENLDKKIHDFENFENLSDDDFFSIHGEIKVLYDKYLEYNHSNNNYKKKIIEIEKNYNQKIFLDLVYNFKNFKILFTPKYLLDLTDKDRFKKKYNISDSTFHDVDRRFKKDIHNYNTCFKNLKDFYKNNSDLKTQNNIILFNQCSKRSLYFNDANIDVKNDYLNNIIFNIEEYFNHKSTINFIDLKQEYIDYIFYLPDEFFNSKKYNMKLLNQDYDKFFNKYDITLQEHIKFLSEIQNYFKKNIIYKKK